MTTQSLIFSGLHTIFWDLWEWPIIMKANSLLWFPLVNDSQNVEIQPWVEQKRLMGARMTMVGKKESETKLYNFLQYTAVMCCYWHVELHFTKGSTCQKFHIQVGSSFIVNNWQKGQCNLGQCKFFCFMGRYSSWSGEISSKSEALI